VAAFDIDALRENILAPKFNFGAASVLARHVAVDGTLDLEHRYGSDGRGLDLNRARKVLAYIHQVWRRPVRLHTIDARGKETTLEHPSSSD
jgi:stage V sporulation protein R